jgi:hypothetical protein
LAEDPDLLRAAPVITQRLLDRLYPPFHIE